MLPYVEHPVLDLGFYRLESFAVLTGAAIVTQYAIVMRRAPLQGIDRRTTSSLLVWAIVLGIVGARVFDVVAYYPERLRHDPFELFRIWGGISSFGGMLGGLLGLYLVMRAKSMSRTDMLRFVDCLIYALPFTLAVGRLGCALQHDHPGISSTHWLAVAFPDGGRFDLGLLEFFYDSLLAALFFLLGRRRWPDGFFIGLFFALYGPVRFALDSLRVSEARYFDWTPGQYLSIFAALIGVWTLAVVLRQGVPRAGADS
ncbi:MAG TPA: prolipoprotein diacylglyceryl transferase family protein [Myxococcota bacterium]|nr:prolipoprotein diacylglyceryl transferase family protein [Myxococcota bacterium]